MSHDVLLDQYARLYEQPYQLAKLGNDVLHVCPSYRRSTAFDQTQLFEEGSIRWIGLPSGPLLENIPTYPYHLLKLAINFKPDIVVASSDCIHICLGRWLSKRLNVSFCADLYDDYETFALSKIPFLKYFYRRALKQANAISCVSNHLADHIRSLTARAPYIEALPSTIDKSVFYFRNKDSMRLSFNLPMDKKIVGTAGGLTKEKGITTVYQAALKTIESNPDIHFALAGPIDSSCPPPAHPRIHYLGKLPHERVAELFCALDVGIVYVRDTPYGRLSFPQKAYEMASCKIPMVVADVGDMSNLFSRERNELYTADDTSDLMLSIQQQLNNPNVANLEIDDWIEHGRKLNKLYDKVTKNHHLSHL